MNPRRLRRWVVAASLGLLVVSCIYLFLRFGSITVPAGMDTMSGTHPPGTWCLVEKTPRVLVAKRSVVFIEVEPGQIAIEISSKIVGRFSNRVNNVNFISGCL